MTDAVSSSSTPMTLPELLAALRFQMDMGVTIGLDESPLALASAAPLVIAPPAMPQTSGAVVSLAETRAKAAASAPSLDLSQITTLEALRDAAATLPLNIRETAAHLVFGEGKADRPPVMLIGEAPGEEEDRTGQPFVGPAGQMLSKMLAAIGLLREDIYITNLLFWRPPGNRAPRPEETAMCLPFLVRHIELVNPKSILLLGGSSGKALLQSDLSVGAMRGKWWPFESKAGESAYPTLVTFHPSYLLRTPAQKRESWRDLRLLKTKLESL